MRKPGKLKKSEWWRRRSRLGRGLLEDESGGVLVYMTVLIPVMMAVIGLAVDASRLFILNTEQKDLADAAAIAGAWELDGEYVSATNNAITRATDAARNVVTNNPRWASDSPGVHIETIRFCEQLTAPAYDEPRTCVSYFTPDLSDASDSRNANFIEVTTEVRSVFPSFLLAVGAVGQPASNAIAIAGSSIVACNVQSLMICNPFEVEDKPFSATKGEMFIFKAKHVTGAKGGGGGTTAPQSFAPGDFGLVDNPDYPAPNGAPATRDLLSLQSRKICISNLVSPHQGHEVAMVNQGVNVRFDEKSFQCVGQCKADMTSAPHVLKGSTTSCSSPNPGPYDASQQYPLEITDTTAYGSTLIGNGGMNPDASTPTAAMDAYWNHHHGSPWPSELDGSTPPRLVVNTRYNAYLREIELMQSSAWGKDPPLENPVPQCLVKSEVGAERRIINAAVIDCSKWGVKGNSVNNIRADTYVELFVTHPSKDGEIYTEFVRMMTPEDDDSKLKRIVQLYR